MKTVYKSKFKKGDKVKIITGKDKGKVGKILTITVVGQRAIIEGVGMVTKHMKKRSESESGGIKKIPAAIDLSNVALFCANCNKGTRVGVSIEGKMKTRICKKCQKPV